MILQTRSFPFSNCFAGDFGTFGKKLECRHADGEEEKGEEKKENKVLTGTWLLSGVKGTNFSVNDRFCCHFEMDLVEFDFAFN